MKRNRALSAAQHYVADRFEFDRDARSHDDVLAFEFADRCLT
ncbi:MAG: hypothetical protein P8Q50_00355 [Octadecabacter sp.]|nr:hypothetical protein [Octadecabacter sp.]